MRSKENRSAAFRPATRADGSTGPERMAGPTSEIAPIQETSVPPSGSAADTGASLESGYRHQPWPTDLPANPGKVS